MGIRLKKKGRENGLKRPYIISLTSRGGGGVGDGRENGKRHRKTGEGVISKKCGSSKLILKTHQTKISDQTYNSLLD